MASEEQAAPVELSEHEQSMVDLVDQKASDTQSAVDPESAPEYKEPEPPTEEIDYKAEYEKLQAANKEAETPEGTSGIEIPKDSEKTSESTKAPEQNTEAEGGSLTPAEMNKFNAEFNETGSLSDGSYKELQGMGLSKDVVDSYIQGQKAVQDAQHAKAYEAVGGEGSYKEMVAWAKDSWSDSQIEVFNQQVQSGNQDQVMFGVESLKAQFKAAGESPIPKRALSGSSAGSSTQGTQGYADKGEMYAAMRNPLYGKDASYTQNVASKVGLSKF